MRKFVLGVVVGIVLAGMAAFVFVGLAALAGRPSKASIANGSTLVYRLEGSTPEAAPVEIPFFESQASLTILNHYEMLRRAATDSRIKAVVFEPYAIDAGWAKLQELRSGLIAFKKSGKPLIAYLHTPGTREYYLATAADKIYMNREDYLNVKGLRLEGMFFKNTLDKLGVEIDAERVGRYKDAPDMFTRTSFSPDSRAVLDSVLDTLYGDLVGTIAQGRKKSAGEIKTILDDGPFLSEQAVQRGLIDGLLYEDEMYGQVQKQLGQNKLEKLSSREYAKAVAGEQNSGKKIAVLTGDGEITRGSTNDAGQNENGITAFGFNKQLRKLSTEDDIAGVILRIDSPGGDAIASDEILREIKLLAQKKPIVISMSDTAASGGYYMAVPGQPIIAYPSTLTGSIGIFFLKPTLKGLFDKAGVTEEILKRGKNADIDSVYRPLDDASRTKLRESIEQFYKNFVQVVAEGRHRKYEDIEPLAQGRVWLGSQAKQNGLVDELGGFDKAIELIKQRAKIGASDKIQLVAYPPKRSLLQQLLNRGNDSVVSAFLPRELQPAASQLNLKLLRDGGMMAYLPLRVQIR